MHSGFSRPILRAPSFAVYQHNCAVGVPESWQKAPPVAAPANARCVHDRHKPADMYVRTTRRDQQTISTRLQGTREQFSGAFANHHSLLPASGIASGTLCILGSSSAEGLFATHVSLIVVYCYRVRCLIQTCSMWWYRVLQLTRRDSLDHVVCSVNVFP